MSRLFLPILEYHLSGMIYYIFFKFITIVCTCIWVLSDGAHMPVSIWECQRTTFGSGSLLSLWFPRILLSWAGLPTVFFCVWMWSSWAWCMCSIRSYCCIMFGSLHNWDLNFWVACFWTVYKTLQNISICLLADIH